ncbi:Conserved_hypothetical protein [Hexamita inflata]|uniref:Uncharacterized protein n=1 Tax=Hexamita inflata TaxID=28002 RepID=A0AA86PGJ0_9EUKA|nr:Conserved hypothetical protein [Hexamita inflata]
MDQTKLVHLSAMLKLTEYIDSLIRQNKNFTADEMKQNPLPDIDISTQVSQSQLVRKFQKLSGQEVTPSEQPAPREISIQPAPKPIKVQQPKAVSEQPKVEKVPAPKRTMADVTTAVPIAAPADDLKITDILLELHQVMKKVMKDPNFTLFINYPADEIIPKYSTYVPYPMCFGMMLVRIYSNLEQGVDPLIVDQDTRANILLNFQVDDYGSFPSFGARNSSEQYAPKLISQFQNDVGKFAQKIHGALKIKPKPYLYVSEIVRDFILIGINCWYFNYLSDPIKTLAIQLLRDTQRQFIKFYSKIVWPYWAKYLFEKPEELDYQEAILDKIKQIVEWQKKGKQFKNFNPDELLDLMQLDGAENEQVFQELGEKKEEKVKNETKTESGFQIIKEETPFQETTVKKTGPNKENLIDEIEAAFNKLEEEELFELIDITGGENLLQNMELDTLQNVKDWLKEHGKL